MDLFDESTVDELDINEELQDGAGDDENDVDDLDDQDDDLDDSNDPDGDEGDSEDFKTKENAAFAKMRRELDEQKKKNAELVQQNEKLVNKARQVMPEAETAEDVLDNLVKIKIDELKEKAELGDTKALLELNNINLEETIRRTIEKSPAYEKIQEQELDRTIDDQIAMLNEEHGLNIKSQEELRTLPNIETIRGHLAKGVSLSDAYFLANKKTVMESEKAKGRKAALSKKQRTARHAKNLSTGTGASRKSLSKDSLAAFREMSSGLGFNISDEELIKKYGK